MHSVLWSFCFVVTLILWHKLQQDIEQNSCSYISGSMEFVPMQSILLLLLVVNAFPAKRQGAFCRQAQLKGATILPLDGLARSKQDLINRRQHLYDALYPTGIFREQLWQTCFAHCYQNAATFSCTFLGWEIVVCPCHDTGWARG